MKYNVFDTDVYGEKLLLFYPLMLKIVDSNYANFKCIGKISNDLLIICLAYCLVLSSIV